MSSQPDPPADLSRHGLDTHNSQYLKNLPPDLSQKRAMDILNEGKWVFRALTETEVKEFRSQARINYKPFSLIKGIWHPIYQLECVRINHENSSYSEERRE